MSSATLKLEILTPSGPMAATMVEEEPGVDVAGVQVPGVVGELGILPGHIALVTPVSPGVVRFVRDGKDERIAVGTGFVEVDAHGHVSILVDRAIAAADVDVSTVQTAAKQAREALAKDSDSIERDDYRRARAECEWLEAQLNAARH